MSTLAEVLAVLEGAYPLEWAESWDRVGLVLGEREAEVRRVLLAVDPSVEVARDAVEDGADLLVTHHPLLLRGASFLPADQGKGRVVTDLLRAGTALWCGHTNVDRSTRGTVGAWVRALGLHEARPLAAPTRPETAAHGSALHGMGAIGELAEATTVGELAERVSALVPETARGILHTGDAGREVRTVAVCPGAGDSLLPTVQATDADVYITSDLRHHPVLEHLESAAAPAVVAALIDVPHAASEALWLPEAAALLRETLPHLEVSVTARTSDPWGGRI
ncbi:Nif3-like dinuclear metal center hexameric protein [Brachybacterium sp. DNPG3]